MLAGVKKDAVGIACHIAVYFTANNSVPYLGNDVCAYSCSSYDDDNLNVDHNEDRCADPQSKSSCYS